MPAESWNGFLELTVLTNFKAGDGRSETASAEALLAEEFWAVPDEKLHHDLDCNQRAGWSGHRHPDETNATHLGSNDLFGLSGRDGVLYIEDDHPALVDMQSGLQNSQPGHLVPGQAGQHCHRLLLDYNIDCLGARYCLALHHQTQGECLETQ